MKGISLPINSIIIIILAVLVLVALLFFFTSGFTPGEQNILLKSQQTNFCSKYANLDPTCNDPDSVDPSITKEIARIGDKLGYPPCVEGSPAINACVKECCSTFCGE